MKRKKLGLYDPYLDTFGGGEKHILSICKVFEDRDYDLDIFWNHDVSEKLQTTLNLSFLKAPTFIPNIFPSGTTQLQKLSALRNYDLFFYVTDGSYFFSSAKKNYVFCMYPLKGLYNKTFMNKLKLLNYTFISNSKFTQKWLAKWGISAEVLYPYIEDEYINAPIEKYNKEKIILVVGRFFRQLHSKRQDVAINYFKHLKSQVVDLEKYKLIIAGGLKDEDREYFQELQNMIKDDKSIELKPNISFKELFELYKKSELYWHFAGYGVDAEIHPESVEHLGITPLEAMAMGCVTFCYNAGGPAELITSGENGYLFSNKTELTNALDEIFTSKNKKDQVTKNAKEFITDNFSYKRFAEKVLSIIKP